MSSRQERAVVPVQQETGKPYLDRADIVIIGNGIAGLTAAVEARRLAPDKRIVIITDQKHPTINTPALKQFAVGKLAREQLLAYPPGTERLERIHVVTARVEEIHAQSKYVSLSGNRGFGYDSLLIATGSAPMGLPDNIPGRDFDGVMMLHRLQDYLDFRRRIPEVTEAVVIGGGVHANETVMGLLYWGIRVHWLIRSPTFMGRILDETSSEMVLNNMRRAGAIVHTGTEVTGVVARVGSVVGVITNHQEMIPCQLVLTCTGTQAVTTLAGCCSVPMKQKRGIFVDDKLRTSVRDIYAAGDCAAIRDPLTGEFETRPVWYSAVLQGRIAGAMMAGHRELARPFGVQWHATHLGELSMLTVGDPMSKGSGIETLTDIGQGGYRRMAIRGDRLVGYLSLGPTQPDSLSIKRIMDEGHSTRAITRALLKGDFDAREYLSQVRSRAAQGYLTGRLPDPGAGGEMMPMIEAPAAAQPRTENAAPRTREPAPVESWRTALPQPAASNQTPEAPVIVFEQEMSPFTGNLPPASAAPTGRVSEEAFAMAVGGQQRGPLVEEMSAFTGNLPQLAQPAPFIEEVSPFTGNLPPVGERVVESVPSTRANGGNARKLWFYAGQGK